uniref:Cell growth regulator with EF hand domain protein 1 n=1 Tax=Saimiri boliviensis boliviensis TaxID=39432 RepID=A0A2K6TW74_SAIBB
MIHPELREGGGLPPLVQILRAQPLCIPCGSDVAGAVALVLGSPEAALEEGQLVGASPVSNGEETERWGGPEAVISLEVEVGGGAGSSWPTAKTESEGVKDLLPRRSKEPPPFKVFRILGATPLGFGERTLPGDWGQKVDRLSPQGGSLQGYSSPPSSRPDSEVQHQLLPNPFQPGPEQLRLLQSYLKGLERTEVKPEHLSREQVLLYLFALHDYDQSGQLDGLELLSMLTAALAPGAASSPTTNPVILIVDKVLETQDLNGDGLMTPAELINFPGEAPSHVEPREPLAPSPQEPRAVGRQSLLAKSPLRQDTQEALGPREEAEGQVEAKTESLEPVQEPGGQAEADRDGPEPIGEAGGQAEAEDVPRPKGEAEGQAEARENGKEAKELPGEILESKNTPNEFEVHLVQLENDEI